MATGNVDQANAVTSGGLIATATALAANDQRRRWFIQNNDTHVLFVKLGAGCDATSVYDMTLKACTGAADGTGGSYEDNGSCTYTGIVTVNGTTPSYTVFEA